MKESVKSFIFGLGRLDYPHVIMLQRVSFYNHLSTTNNYTLSDLFWSYQDDYFNIENCLSSVFKTISAVKRCIYELFYPYANS